MEEWMECRIQWNGDEKKKKRRKRRKKMKKKVGMEG